MATTRQTIHDGDTFEHRGRTFKARIERDECMGEPWKEHDGHGVVSESRPSRDTTTGQVSKSSSERLMYEDHGWGLFYDVRASIALAKRDGWGCPHTEVFEVGGRQIVWGGHTSPGKVAACAVDADYEQLRRWCADDWEWSTVTVTLLNDDDEETESTETESLSGIESDAGAYLDTVARELASEIMSRVEVDAPDVVLSKN